LHPIVKATEYGYTPSTQFKPGPEIPANSALESNTMALLEQRQHEICDRHRIDLVYAFGSRACEIREFLCGRGEMDQEQP
jgi:hypothetical protein